MAKSKRGNRGETQATPGRPSDQSGDIEASEVKDEEHKTNKANIKLDDWQVEALEEKGNLLLCTGRQVGKTTIMSIKAVEEMIARPGTRIIVCSLTEDQAQLIIIMVLDYLQRKYKSWIAKGKHAPTKSSVTLNNKSKIIARPVGNTGDAVRGFTGDILILDEASRFNEFIFTAAKPTLLTTGGKIWICSTPFGKQGYFYDCYLNKSGRFKVIHTNSWDVVNNREISDSWTPQQKKLAIEYLEAEKKDMSELQFAQEYLGMFVDDLRQLFSDAIIDKSCILKRPTLIPRGSEFYMGVDIARLGEDETTFEIIQKINKDYFRQIENLVYKKRLTTDTYDTIVALEKQYNFKQIGIDAGAGALGVGILDFLLRNDYVKRKMIALNNLSRNLDSRGERKRTLLKEDMYLNMLAMMEKEQLKLLDDEDLRLSLKSIQYEYVATAGKKTQVRIFSNYGHIAEGLVRASWLANQKSLNLVIDYI